MFQRRHLQLSSGWPWGIWGAIIPFRLCKAGILHELGKLGNLYFPKTDQLAEWNIAREESCAHGAPRKGRRRRVGGISP